MIAAPHNLLFSIGWLILWQFNSIHAILSVAE